MLIQQQAALSEQSPLATIIAEKMPNNSYKGFTLVELLIVISIIAILSIIGIVMYSSFLRTARDNRRLSDLKIIQSALEDYHADQIYYPASLGTSLTFGTSKTYLNTVPTDPKPPPNYSYVPSPSGCTGSACTGYCLFANMEGTAPRSDSGCTSFPQGYDYDYGVTRP